MSATSGSTADLNSRPSLSSRAKLSAIMGKDLAEAARADGNDNSLWLTASSAISSTSLRYTRFDHEIEVFEWDLHDLWYLYAQASINISDQRAEQDRLVVQILQAREQGVLVRREPSMEVKEEASTSDGKIWSDLPFLVGDMTDYWLESCASMSTEQRQNFASFLAKLSAVSIVADDKLCGCALIALREALESTKLLAKAEPITVIASDGNLLREEQHTNLSCDSLAIADLLPAANSWLFHASQKIIQLSEKSANGFPPRTGMLGELARAAGVKDDGFSSQRWLFWVRRLEEIARSEAVGEAEKKAATLAQKMVGNMTIPLEESDTTMRYELIRQGKLQSARKVF